MHTDQNRHRGQSALGHACVAAVLAAALVIFQAAPPALASALDADTCTKLKAEQEELEKSGVKAKLGPGESVLLTLTRA